MNPLRLALGLDIGGTKIAIGVVATDGRVLASNTIATESRRGPQDATARIAQAVRQTLQDCGRESREMAGVGVGCAGPVNPLTGVIHNPHTLPGWDGWAIDSSLRCALDLPVWLENDADVAALGEYYHGAGQAADNLAMLTLGTGVGGALIVGGEIYRGANGEHPEIGHMPILFGGAKCYCGRSGCLESITSGPAIAAAGAPFGLGGAAQVFAAAVAGHPAANQILAEVRNAVGAAIWTLAHVYFPARIILGGGQVDAHSAFFLEAARAPLHHTPLISRSTVEITSARLGKQAGLVGAARWAIERSIATNDRLRRTSAPLLDHSP
jgi:glucokinase